jgi:hypothetical protein
MVMSDSNRSSKRYANETPEQREKRLAYHREWMKRFRREHPEKAREANERYREKNPEKYRQRYLENYARNRKKIITAACEYSKRNRAKINARNVQRRRENLEKYTESERKKYVPRRLLSKESLSELRAKEAAYMRRKRNESPAFLVADRLRRRINCVMASASARKSAGLVDVSGCTVNELVKHIESQFLEGMSWANRRRWHIDHIIPCSAFDLTDPAQQKVAFHYTNLRPVWSSENQRKHAKVPGGQRQFFWTHDDIKRARKRLA